MASDQQIDGIEQSSPQYDSTESALLGKRFPDSKADVSAISLSVSPYMIFNVMCANNKDIAACEALLEKKTHLIRWREAKDLV